MPITFEPRSFDELPGWQADDQNAALLAFSQSLSLTRYDASVHRASLLSDLSTTLAAADRLASRRFFERWFVPCAISGNDGPGLVTGYYEPHLPARRTPDAEFCHPVYRRPSDLVNAVDESLRGARNGSYTHLRRTPDGLVPYPTRREIDAGALDGRNLEHAYVRSAVDLFFLHVQGSGILDFEDGTSVRIAYDGKNGHPYSSIGRHLIEAGRFHAEELTMPVLIAFLEADADRARNVMWVNDSYVFFRELPPSAATPLGVDSIPLTPGRSLAVDMGVHAVGTPIYVLAPTLADPAGGQSFARLMVAQDAGSAIRGAERGDIYYGSGPEAGAQAGTTKHPARFFAFKPRWEM